MYRIMLEEVDHLSGDRVVVSEVVSDDDSTLRSHCAAVENGGKLTKGVRKPKFFVDPTHRTKAMVKFVFALVKRTKTRRSKKIDALRLKKFISCYITQYWNGDFEYFYQNTMAPVEYLFDNHIYAHTNMKQNDNVCKLNPF